MPGVGLGIRLQRSGDSARSVRNHRRCSHVEWERQTDLKQFLMGCFHFTLYRESSKGVHYYKAPALGLRLVIGNMFNLAGTPA